MTPEHRSSAGPAAAGAVIGGLIAAIGSILAWAKASVSTFSVSAKGIDGWEGKATIVGGLILLVGGLSAVTRSSPRARLGGSAILGGLIAAGVGLYTALTAEDQVIEGAASEIAKELSVPIEQAKNAVQQAIDQGVLSVSLQIGLYLVIGGGLLGILVGVLSLMSRGEPTPSVPAAPTSGLTGWAAPTPPPAPPAPERASDAIAHAPDVWASAPPPPPAPAAKHPPPAGAPPPPEPSGEPGEGGERGP